jgi:Fic family protein
MTLYAPPSLDRTEREVIARIDDIRGQVRFVSAEPKAWAELLAPLFLSGEASNHAETARRVPAGAGADAEPRAFAGYLTALQYVLSLHDDPHFVYHESLVRSLHYMTLSHAPDKRPGRWRTATTVVYGRGGTEVFYEPPPADHVPGLMGELMASLNGGGTLPVVVRAATAHLNLVQIHPFADGNGRLGRALQTLVMVREGVLDPEFSSIERSVANDRSRYRESLYELGPAWNPATDTRPFVRYCLAVHLDQAERALVHARRMSAVWAQAADEMRRERWPDRLIAAVADAAFTGHVDVHAYRPWAHVDDRRARADLQRLADRGFLRRLPGRGASYAAGPMARAIRERVWAAEPPYRAVDPFA